MTITQIVYEAVLTLALASVLGCLIGMALLARKKR
jgi:hypothetical protein